MLRMVLTLPKDLKYSESSRSQVTRVGMDRAKKRGVRIGRPRLPLDLKKLKKLAAQMSHREIARQMGCSYSRVQRALAKPT